MWQDILGAGGDNPVKCMSMHAHVCVFVSGVPRDSAGLDLSDLDRGSQEGALGGVSVWSVVLMLAELSHPSLFLAVVSVLKISQLKL